MCDRRGLIKICVMISKLLWVGGLPGDITEDVIKPEFTRFGKVLSISIKFGKVKERRANIE